MPSPELAKQLADLGGLALFLAHILVDAIGLFRRWWVPQWVYADQRQALLDSEAEVKRLTRSVARLPLALARERRRRRTDARPDG